ncbi:hypothetical protein [Pyramidobacter piscolens]|uniref:hypothetical protein n=1 Tax=Pyramidobacter piscolens TaxID=638849 RepID=UPI002AB03250|nr:hypothetical protein [Pyramidobacter piscolens]
MLALKNDIDMNNASNNMFKATMLMLSFVLKRGTVESSSDWDYDIDNGLSIWNRFQLPDGAVDVQFYWDEDEWKPYDRPEDGQIDGMMLDSDIEHVIEFIVYDEDDDEIFRGSDYCEVQNV